ncbi:hypothetical protein BP5796_11195 [Coleophoma crateriformis]|uniref:AB hydrolase-1 domain-containing protein n=1 Tax=Coleophoma crateriformis TaxID=565419 RepID=A0A3D8QHI1_9HELO|nr:hypothetical protein BP5796_11195 [Coleophoma crateriformis]
MAPSVVKKGYADISLGQIHYRYALPTTAAQKTPIIFLHKSASSSKSYENLIEYYVSQGHPCYAPDMPGFGGSFDTELDPSPPYSTTWYCSIFEEVFRQLDLFAAGKKVHLCGHHSGSTLALEMGVTYAEYIKSITMIGAGLMNEAERLEMKSHYFAPFNKPVMDGSHLLKTWNYLQQGEVAEDLELMQSELLDHARAWLGRMQIYGAVWNSDRQKNFMQIKCPMLALCARDDVLWQYFHYVNELRPEVRAEEVGGGNFEEVLAWKECAKFMDEMYAEVGA